MLRRPPTSGSFKKGQSGNPKGRPKQFANVTEMLRGESENLGRKLMAFTDHPDPKIAYPATVSALNWAIGKPMQEHQIGGNGGLPIVQKFLIDTGFVDEEGTTEHEAEEGKS